MNPAWAAAYRAVLLEQFLPVVLAVMLLATIVSGVGAMATGRPFRGFMSFTLAFGFLGGTAGLISGASAEPVVGALLTGLLGLVSALLSFLFAKETLKSFRDFIPAAITLLCLSALAGLSIGRVYKTQWSNYDQDYARWLLQHEKVDLEVMKLQKRFELCMRQASADASRCREILYVSGK